VPHLRAQHRGACAVERASTISIMTDRRFTLALALALLAVATPSHADAPSCAGPRVFVTAHSFMIFTAKLLPPMSEAAGIPYVAAGQQMLGGSRVIQHWNLPDDKNRAKASVNAGTVDVLTLSPHILLPDEGIDNFTKLGVAKNPNLRVLVQASWPARDGHEGAFKNAERDAVTRADLAAIRQQHSVWVKALEKQVAALNASVGKEAVCIIPVDEAVFALRERVVDRTAPGISKQSELFRDDLGHPNAALAILVTYCHFAAIHHKSPVGLPVPAELKDQPQAEALNHLLQVLAWNAVTTYPHSGVEAKASVSSGIEAP
jgi:hypothetical protein